MAVKRIEDSKVLDVTIKKQDPFQEPNAVVEDPINGFPILGIAFPKKSDSPTARYSAKLAED